MRVLILGGTGAMGKPLVTILAERGNEVHVTSRRKYESTGNIHYIEGDAHDLSFIKGLLKSKYDAIVDFMIYSTELFQERVGIYLDSTDQYIFLSSARVYSDSMNPITENSSRLLDVCKDENYMKTDEYALAKARAENLLFESKMKNWTIFRPYITYNTDRLQFGGLELCTWVTATLAGRPLMIPREVVNCATTMTYGKNVAEAIALLIGNIKAFGEVFNVTGTDHMTWNEIAELYLDVIEEHTGKRPGIYTPKLSDGLLAVLGNAYQIKYDRTYNRVFDNSKLLKTLDSSLGYRIDFLPMKYGIRKCLEEYLSLLDEQNSKTYNVKYMAWIDKNTGGRGEADIRGAKEKLKYLGYYYAPRAMDTLKKLSHS